MVLCIFKQYFKQNTCNKEKNDLFIIYSDDLNEVTKDIKKLKLSEIKIKTQNSIYKFIGDYAFVNYKEKCIGILFQTNSCLSYIETKIDGIQIRIGNIDTLMNLYFSFILMEIKEINRTFVYYIVL